MKQVIQAIEKQLKIEKQKLQNRVMQKSNPGAFIGTKLPSTNLDYVKELNNAWMVLSEAQNQVEGVVSRPTFKYKHLDGTYSDIEVNLFKIID